MITVTSAFDSTKPDSTPHKLMDGGRLSAMVWKATSTLQTGLAVAYRNFLAATK